MMKPFLPVKISAWPCMLLLLTGCIDEDITHVSENIEVTSSYSIPGGPLTYNINEYLDTLHAIHVPWSSFLYYNDILLPNYLSYLTYDDVKGFDFSSLSESLDKLESVMFRLVISYDYPTRAYTQVYFADEGFVFIDSAFAGGPHPIEPAPFGSDGMHTVGYEDILDVYMSPQFVDNMMYIRNIIIRSIIYTTRPDIQQVRFYDYYSIDVNVAARIQLRVNTGDL